MVLGGVGLCADMAAKARGCHTIIRIDQVTPRLKLVKELSPTHVVNTPDASLDVVVK